jgi:hypothetical protein
MGQAQTIYHLRIKLKFDKRTYRDILILGDQSFDQLHEIIFTAFDRYDEHLYSFTIKARPEVIRIVSPECCGECYGDELDAEETKLEKFNLVPKQKFEYLFDFGDQWQHEIEVIGVAPFETGSKYPRIIKVNGKSPDQYPEQDCE